MAKTPSAVRAAVTVRGIALLALIAAAPGGVLMLTQEEGSEAVAAGYAVVDETKVDGNTAAVSLTDQGKAQLTSAAPATAAVASGFAIDTNIPIPVGVKSRAGRSGGYPFDALQVGQSFHTVPKSDGEDDADKLMTRLSSSISAARAKYAEPTGETETVIKKTFKRLADDSGFEKDAEGKRVVESESEVEQPKMRNTRDFTAAIVDDSDPKKAGVRVWRTA